MALLVIASGLLLYVPLAGTYGLWDPWETHYSEVARQMTNRGDFISPWWPGSPRDLAVFWSKPVLSFWLMCIGMHAARVGLPGGEPAEVASGRRPARAVRAPFCCTGGGGGRAVSLRSVPAPRGGCGARSPKRARFWSRRIGGAGSTVWAPRFARRWSPT